MDSITQILLGASVAASIAPKESRKRAMLAGAALGTLPDLDVLIPYTDDIVSFTSHRGFSHSLFVLPIIALVLMPLMRKLFQSMSSQRLYLLTVLGLVTHPLLDAFTSYGTQLFYPFDFAPVDISSVFIIDFIYSVPLLVALVVYAFCSKAKWLNSFALMLSTAYLVFGVAMQYQAKNELVKAFPQTQSSDWFVGVLNASPFCWRGVYTYDGGYTETAFNVVNPQTMAVQKYRVLADKDIPQNQGVQKLEWFSSETVFRKRYDAIISTDLRMGEFGRHMFEFIVEPEKPNSRLANKLDDQGTTKYTKQVWKPHFSNAVADEYVQRINAGNVIRNKFEQFGACLGGGF